MIQQNKWLLVKSDNVHKSEVPNEMNLPDWTSIVLRLNADIVDLSACSITNYKYVTDMFSGLVVISYDLQTPAGYNLEVTIETSFGLEQPVMHAINYRVKSIDYVGKISFTPTIQGDFSSYMQSDARSLWNVLQSKTAAEVAHLWIQIRKSNYQLCEAMGFDFFKNNTFKKLNPTKIEKEKTAGYSFGVDVVAGEYLAVHKFVAFAEADNKFTSSLTMLADGYCLEAKTLGWNALKELNAHAWKQKWQNLEAYSQYENASNQTILGAFEAMKPDFKYIPTIYRV
ncbi:MAG: hypothetical protein AUK44_02105 [Porphyromonadaceae bacterium CG2_30_38_12]|nr:MAG: hypothetical protein AUK44_02105 [Porphyromonadaceae bacterium CG2_30_38_12]